MKKILLVDDLAIVRRTLKRIFEKLGFSVVECERGDDAIEQFEKCAPDLVTMDISLPDMNGVNAVKKIRSIDPGAKIIMITGSGDRDMLLQAVKAGACDFIVKPIDIARVQESIRKHLG